MKHLTKKLEKEQSKPKEGTRIIQGTENKKKISTTDSLNDIVHT